MEMSPPRGREPLDVRDKGDVEGNSFSRTCIPGHETAQRWGVEVRQELVFIGQGLKHETIQKILDKCLLNYKEIKMGPEKWEEAIADVGKIQLILDYGDDEE